MKTTKINLELPPTLPHGWKTKVAETLTIHPNTVKEALKRGGEDPTYLRIMQTAKNMYGKPIKPQEDEEKTRCHF